MALPRSLRLERQLSPHTASNYARDLAVAGRLLRRAGHRRLDAARRAAHAHVRGARAPPGPRAAQHPAAAFGLPRPVPLPAARRRNATRPGRRRAGAQGAQTAADHARCRHDGAPARVSQRRLNWACATRRSWNCSIRRGCASPNCSGLDLADVDLRDRTVRVLGKGRKTRIVPVGKQAVERDAAMAGRARRHRRRRRDRFFRRYQRPQARPAHRAATHRALGTAAGLARARAPAHVPALVRIAPARIVSRTCAPCRNCSATRTSARRRCTRILISSTWPASTTQRTRGRESSAPDRRPRRSPRYRLLRSPSHDFRHVSIPTAPRFSACAATDSSPWAATARSRSARPS